MIKFEQVLKSSDLTNTISQMKEKENTMLENMGPLFLVVKSKGLVWLELYIKNHKY